MHGQAGPRSDVDVLVMEIVDGLVKRPPMDQAVNPVEMELAPKRDGAQPERAIERMGLPIDSGDMVVCRRPHVEHLVGGPDGATTDATPEDVVIDLVAEKEFGVVGAEPARVVFAFSALDLQREKEKVPPSADQPEQAEIPQEHEPDPIRLELDATRERGLQAKPGDDGDEDVNGIPRPKKTRVRQ